MVKKKSKKKIGKYNFDIHIGFTVRSYSYDKADDKADEYAHIMMTAIAKKYPKQHMWLGEVEVGKE